ncbi:MAG: alpha/beta fold hydrolase [Actinomycetes bacterium]
MVPRRVNDPDAAPLGFRRIDAREPVRPPDLEPADPIVMVHGFAQNGRCWGPIDVALAAKHELLLVDAPGHGTSRTSEFDLIESGEAIAAVGGLGTYCGYSMGARMCLHVALNHPDRVTHLILISATAGIEDVEQRRDRHRTDNELANRIVAFGVPAFLHDWLALPMFGGLSDLRQHREERLDNSAEGLASSLRLAGVGNQVPLWDRLHEIAVPVLIIAGTNDKKFAQLATRISAGIGGNAECVLVANAGHSVHLDQPDVVVNLILEWLARTTRSETRQLRPSETSARDE